jgi:hypothetical protein
MGERVNASLGFFPSDTSIANLAQDAAREKSGG